MSSWCDERKRQTYKLPMHTVNTSNEIYLKGGLCCYKCTREIHYVPGGPFYQHGLTVIPARMNIYVHHKVCDEFIYQFSNFNCGMDKGLHPKLNQTNDYLSVVGQKLIHGSKMDLDMASQGLPYIPRVHLSEGSLVRSPLKWLWSEEPMVRRSFIPKFLYSESCYVPKIPYSERPSTIWILCYEDSLVRSSSSPKGAMFRTFKFRKSPLPHTGSILRRSFSPKFPQF